MKKRKTKYNLLFYSMIVLSIFSVGILSTLLLSPNVRNSVLSKLKNTQDKNSNGTPLRSKVLRDNGDGTYTLSLDVTGDSEKITPKVNVIVIVDRSGSMGESSGTGAYVAANDTSDNRFGLVNGQYIRLTREGTNNYNRTYWYTNSAGERVQYTGQRYQYDSSATRLEATKAAVNKLANKLLGYNGNGNPDDTVEMSLISFSGPNQPTPQIQTNVRKTNTFTTYETAVNGLGAQGGTNWEIALQTANGIDFEDDDPTFVIFFTDGAPTRYGTNLGTGQEREPNMKESYDAATDDAATLAQNVGVNNFYTIFAYGTTTGSNYLRDLTAAAGAPATNNYSASSTAELEAAFDEILSKIEQAGFADVSINDGTTAAVQASSGSVSGGLLEVDKNFKYYLSFPLKENGQSDIPEITNITLVSNDQYKLTDANGNEYTVTRVPAYEQDTKTGRETDVVLENVFKFEWVDAQNPLHKTTPPEATFDENPTIKNEHNEDVPNPNYGAVDWDLSSLDVLKNNVTYTVSFDCYPSQVTLDIIADIKNDPSSYEDLDDTVKQYLDSNGNLKTNTGATLKYDDTRTTADESKVPIDFNDVTPVETKTVEALSVAKEWDGGNPDPKITLYVDRDNDLKKYYTELSSPTYKGSVNASIGIMKYDTEGNVTVLTPGHDYKFSEDNELSHIWDFTTPTIHPMMINGKVYTLLQVPEGSVTMTKDHEIQGDNEYFRLTLKNGNTTTTKIYVVGSEDAVLTAKNVKRSHLDFNKVVVGKDAANANPEDLFTFDATITTKTGTDFWFSIWNGSGYVVNTTDKQYITNATQEVIVVDTKDTANIQNWNKTDSEITYKERNAITGQFEDKKISSYVSCTEVSEGKYSIITGFYYAPSGTHVTYQIQRDWNVRFTYVPTGSTYTIKELVDDEHLDEAYRFIDITGVGTQDNRQVTGSQVSGTLKEASTTYKETFKNEYLLTHVDVEKVWDDADNQDGKRPDSVTVILKRDGVEVEGKSVVLDGKTTIKDETTGEEVADPNEKVAWKTTFNNLPVYNKTTNQPYVYTIDEIITSNDYQKDVTCNMVGTQTEGETTEGEEGEEASEDEGDPDPTAQSTMSCVITNTHTPETKKVKVVKVWDDANDQDGLRRSGNTTATVALTEDGTASSTMKVTSGTDITKNKFESEVYTVPVYKPGEVGQEIAYSAVEASVPTGYEKSDVATTTETIDGEEVTVFTITNTHTPATKKVRIAKAWDDANNQDNLRNNATIALVENGETSTTKTFTTDGTTTADYADFEVPVYKPGEVGVPATYSATETVTPRNYTTTNTAEKTTVTEEGVEIEVYTIKNTHTPLTKKVRIAKAWDDADNQDGLRNNATIALIENGTTSTTKTFTTDGTTTADYADFEVPVNQPGKVGVPATYSATETVTPRNYTTTNVAASSTTTVDGKEIEVYTITNTHTPATKKIKVVKVWEDNNDQDGLRKNGTTATIAVTEDGTASSTMTLTSGSDITKNKFESEVYTVPVYKPGSVRQEVIYSAVEATTPDKYTKSDVVPSEEKITNETTGEEETVYVFTITNTHTPEQMKIKVVKDWEDADNQDGLREPATITLYAGETATQNTLTTIEDLKSATFTVDKYANGSEIVYSVQENELDGYTTTIVPSTEDVKDETTGEVTETIKVFTVINTHTPATKKIQIKKVFSDANNQDGIRENATIAVTEDGTASTTMTLTTKENEASSDIYTVPVNKAGTEITYSATETVTPDGYTAGDVESEDVTINGETVTVFTITNTHTPATKKIQIKKVFSDSNNQDGIRKNATIAVTENGTASTSMTLTTKEDAAESDIYTVPVYKVGAEGQEVTYSATETVTPDGYTPSEVDSKDVTINGETVTVFTITNIHTPATKKVRIAKAWDDNNDQDGLREKGVSATIALIENGTTSTTKTFTTDGKTTADYADFEVPVYKAGSVGVPATYSATETTTPTGYTTTNEAVRSTTTVDGKEIEVYTITNTHTPETKDIKVVKAWSDDNNHEGFRPSSVTFQLTANGSNYGQPVTVKFEKDILENNWSYTFEDLDVYANGSEIVYDVVETPVPNYEGSDAVVTTERDETTGEEIKVLTITNSRTVEKIPVTVKKVWNDENNKEGYRPASVTFNLFGVDKTKPVQSATFDGTNTDENGYWTYTFTNLDKYANGELINYTITEDTVANYTPSIQGLTITNSRGVETTTVTVEKDWQDANNKEGFRPPSVQVQLKDGNNAVGTPVTLDASNNWKYEWTGLQKIRNQQPIEYTVEEVKTDVITGTDDVGTYAISVTETETGYKITNTHTPKTTGFTITKVWSDRDDEEGFRPDEIEIEIHSQTASETEAKLETVIKLDGEVDENGPETAKWVATLSELPKYRNGEEIEYTVYESRNDVLTGTDGVGTYAISETGNAASGFTITNTHTPTPTSVTVEKDWQDASDKEGFRPESVTIILHASDNSIADQQVTITGTPSWSHTFTDLLAYKDGKKITYTVEEVKTDVITGTDGTGTYAISVTETATGYKVTNTHTPETTTSTVVKVWDDNSNQDKVRPAVADIEFQLQANGTDVGEPVTLTDAGNNRWTKTVSNLPKYADGELIEYTWVEDEASLKELGYTLTSAELSNDKLTYTMTNYRETDKITINGKKTWADSSNNDQVRPLELNIQLFANGTAVEGQTKHLEAADYDATANEWTFSFEDLEVNDANGPIVYTVDEVDSEGKPTEVQYYDKTQTGNKENGYEIINKHDKETTSVKATKVWDDDSNRDAIQPENVTFELFANGDKVGSKVLDGKVDKTGEYEPWKVEFTGLDKLYNGEEIEYTVEEVKTGVITGKDENGTYAVSVTGDQVKGYTITNTHTPETVDIDVKKVWNDDDNRDALRPDEVTFYIYQDGSETPFRTETVTFKENKSENTWYYTFSDLPKYKNVNGVATPIKYTIKEAAVDSYRGEVDNSKYTITNIHTPETTTITGYKVWRDDSDKEGKRPGSVTIKLYANGEFYDSKVVSGGKDNEWAYTFEDLPVWYNDKGEAKKVVYTVAEADVANGYVSTIKDKNSETDKFIIINTITGTTEVSGKKIWDDDNNRDGVRLSSVTIVLNADGKKLEGEKYSKTLPDENGKWEYSWTELPKYNEDGTKIVYSVTEELSEEDAKVYTANYETEGNNLNVRNVHTPAKFDINGIKAWDDDNNRDGLRPETVTIALNADGKQIETYTAKATDGWKYEFKGLNKYRDGGVEIKYTLTEIQEASEEGEEGTEEEKEPIYTPIIDGYTITNKHVPETVSYKVSKVWDDDENRDGIRPESITVNLLADGNKVESKTVTGPKWECEFTGLPKYKKGEVGVPITYTITEDIKEGYTASIVPQVDNPTEVVITNTHTPDTIDLDITKTWKGDEDHLDQRPKFVTVYLYADGELIDTITVKEDEEWKYIVENMFKYKGGVPIKYTIDEKDVEGYIKNIDGLNVINTRDSSGDVVPDEEPPHTKVDYNYVYEFVIATLSGIVISFKKEY